MKTTNKNFCSKPNFQHGGMLMEMMLSVALAAITIPFVARYQKNTIERARNVAVVKQMGIVRGALERCIMENRSNYLNHMGAYVFSENDISDPTRIECLVLSDGEDEPHGLINYGLTPEFINDYGNDYTLRIRKSEDNTGQAVLQGIVLLKNGNVNTLSTREIVNLGGGQVGFTDGDYVRGGFNAFSTEKITYGLSTSDQGIIQTTDTTRGDSKYLWRTADSSDEDRTMLSFLNLDMHDIINLAGFSAREADFSDRITLDPAYPLESGKSTIDTLKFANRMNLINTNLTGGSAIVNGNFSAANRDSVLTVNDTLIINSPSSGILNFYANCTSSNNCNAEGICTCVPLKIQDDLKISLCPDNSSEEVSCMAAENITLNFDKYTTRDLELFGLESDSGIVEYTSKAVTSHLRMDNQDSVMTSESAASCNGRQNCIDANSVNLEVVQSTGNLKATDGTALSSVAGLSALVSHVKTQEAVVFPSGIANIDDRYGRFWNYFSDCANNSVGCHLEQFQAMRSILLLKNKCININSQAQLTIDYCVSEYIGRLKDCFDHNYGLVKCGALAECLERCGSETGAVSACVGHCDRLFD